MTRLSTAKRQKILDLYHPVNGESLSLSEIARHVHCDRSTVRRVLQRVSSSGKLNYDIRPKGQPCILSKQDLRELHLAIDRGSVLDSPASISRRQSSTSSRRPSIDPSRLVPMDRASQVSGTGDFNVVFVGAGNIMFGSDEGPWNHSFRFEHKLGPRLKVVALIDPAIERATAVLQKKCETFVRSAYENTRVYKTLEDFVRNMNKNQMPRAVIAGQGPGGWVQYTRRCKGCESVVACG
ncbi:hypothetical protein NUW54_g4820 [Trametes sanguinea]|uniref:Uncharacterized protein n=1 Tax=Trametes sanguinea TaxID=158606 RepID=A0ACC1PWW7_9APHY|nr:hypothetical protein NUW54_g4820 [Trametes sanguinea]